MLERTKKHLTESTLFSVYIPKGKEQDFKKALATLDCHVKVEQEYYTMQDVFTGTENELASSCLRGLRYREDMTQADLEKCTGISRRHISEMENGKRPIGKNTAKKLADVFNINPKVFLTA